MHPVNTLVMASGSRSPNTRNVSSAGRSARLAGIVPVSRFMDRSISVSPLKVPISAGMVPVACWLEQSSDVVAPLLAFL